MDQIDSESSSGNLIDIQIEQSLVRETLMVIDSANCKEDLFTLIGFISALIIALAIGILGPQEDINSEHGYIIKYNSKSIEIPFNGIKSTMRTIKVDIYFGKGANIPYFESTASFDVTVRKLKGAHLVGEEKKSIINKTIVFGENDTESQLFNIFSDNCIVYNNINIAINNLKIDARLTQLYVRINNGTEEHTMFQIYIRTIFASFCTLMLTLFLIKLRPVGVSLWHLEQKLTAPLALITMCLNNPLFSFYAFFPAKWFILVDDIFQALYTAYFNLFILILFDSLRCKNRKTDSFFFAPKFVLAIIQFIASLSFVLYKDMLNGDPLYSADVEDKLNWAEFIIRYLFYAYIVVSIVRASIDVDVTERYKLIIYIASCGTALCITLIADLINKFSSFGAESSIKFITNYSVKSIFVMLMIYFHWPYEILNDQAYDESGPSNQLQSDFFVNNE